MTSTTDTLRATLDETAFNALSGLAVSPKPMSGRMMANKLGVSPTTATAALGKLRDAGLAISSREGRAHHWRLNTDNALIRSWLEETRDEPNAPEAAGGSSPYSTGGGGVTFERKVAVQYLAHLLTGNQRGLKAGHRVGAGNETLVSRRHRARADRPSAAAHPGTCRPGRLRSALDRR